MWDRVPRYLQGRAVLARLMVSQIWQPTASSVALCGEGSEKGQCPLPTSLFGIKLPSSSCLYARHFSSSLYATGAFQAANPVLELRGGECKSVCRFFKWNCLGLQKFFYPLTSIHWFLQPEVMGTYLRHTRTLVWGAWCGAGSPCS